VDVETKESMRKTEKKNWMQGIKKIKFKWNFRVHDGRMWTRHICVRFGT
jgi:hypothetical protein